MDENRETTHPDEPSAGKVRHAEGEGSSRAQLKAGHELEHARDEALQAENRARHAGNRANWSK